MNQAMKNGSTIAQAWRTHMTGCTVVAKEQVKQCLLNKGSLSELTSGLNTSTIATKAATVGLKALSTAGNMLVTWGISETISLVATMFDKYANSAEYAKEKANALSSSLTESQNKYVEDSKTIDELASRYEILSKGVSDYGYNISLSSSQYNEYKSIVKQLSDIMPELTTRFNEQGEAIGFVNGKLKDTTKKYQEYQKNQAVDWLLHGDDDGNTYQDAINSLNDQLKEENSWIQKDSTDFLATFTGDYDGFYSTKESMNILQKVVDIYNNSSDTYEAIEKIDQIGFRKDIVGSKNAFYNLIGKKETELFSMNPENMNEFIDGLIEKEKKFQQEYNEAAKIISQSMLKVAFSKDEYWDDLDSSGREKISSVLSGITTDFLKNKGLTTEDSQRVFVQNLINTISENKGGISDALGNILSLNIEDMNVDDARESIENYCSIIAKVLKISLGDATGLFGFKDFFSTASNYDRVVAYASNGTYKTAKDIKSSKGFDQKEVIAAMDKYSINDDEEINKFKEILDTVNTLNEAITKYRLDTKETFGFKKTWDSLDKTGTDEDKQEAKEAKDQLLELAKAGKLTEEAFEKSTIADQLEKAGVSAEQATKKINKMVDSAEQLSAMRTGITAITSAYDEKKNSRHKVVSAPTIESLGNTLGVESWDQKDLDVWETYKKVAGDSSKTLEDLKAAQDDLAASYVNSNNFLSNLNGKNQAYYNGLLKEMGVTNASAITTDILNQKKIEAKLATFDAATATDEEINSLSNYINSLGGTEGALANYVIQKQLANSPLDTSASVQNLINLATQCGATSDVLMALQSLLSATDELSDAKNKDLSEYNASAGTDAQHIAEDLENQKYEDVGKAQTKVDKKKNELVKIIKKAKNAVNTTKGNKTTSPSGNSGSNDSGSEKAKQTTQEIDWISRAIERTTAKVDLLNARLQNIFNVDKKKNNINEQIKQTTKLINVYDNAVTKYTKKAKNVKLSSGLKKLVRNGKFTGKNKKLIKEYDEETASNIQKYQDYYDKAQDAKKNRAAQKTAQRELEQQKLQGYVDLYDSRIARAEAKEATAIGYVDQNKAVDTQIRNTELSYQYQIKIAKLTKNKAEAQKLEYELEKKITELKLQQIQNIQKDYENRIGLVDNAIQDIDNSISLAQARGNIITAGYYQNLNKQQTGKRSKAVAEQQTIQAKLAEGGIEKDSDEWYEVQSMLQQLDNTINECDVAIAENTTAIREVHTALLDAKAQNINNLNTEAAFIASLLSRNDLTDSDTGTFTNAGLGTLGTYGIELETSQSMIRELNEERTILEAMKKSGSLNYGDGYHKYDSINQLEEAYTALIEKQQEWVKTEFDAEQKIIDLMKEKYQAQLDYMKEIIDAKKEVLSYEKDLYDYERNIADKTKNIATLEKQLAALQGDNSEEGRARKTQIQLSLDEANQDLQDTEYDKYISDQQNMLDNLYAEYEDLMNNLFKDTDALLQQGIEAINNNAMLIQGILNKTVADYGYDYSDNFQNIMEAFKEGSPVVTDIKNSLNGDESSISRKLDVQNDYLEKKYGESNGDDKAKNTGDDKTPATPTPSSNITTEAESISVGGTTTQVSTGKSTWGNSVGGMQNWEKTFKGWLKNNSTGKKPKVKTDKTSNYNKYSSDLNKELVKKYGYYLSSANGGLKALSNWLNIPEKSFDNNWSKNGNVYKELKELSCFRTGGIVRATGVPSDGDYIPIRVNPNETVLTQDFTDMLPTAVDIMDKFVQIQGLTRDNALPQRGLGSQTFGDIVINAELPNVHSAKDFVHALQNDAKVQKAFTIATKDLMNKGRITNNIQSIS